MKITMEKALKIEKSVVEVGATQPIRILHITDAHMDIIKSQGKSDNTDFFEAAMVYARENGRIIVCTGDNFKGVSEDNIEYAKAVRWCENDVFLPGNHDFCICPDNEGLSNPLYQVKCTGEWVNCYEQNMYFDSKIINGVNFVSLQNVYYSITYGQVQMLQHEVTKGYPIVLCMHVPLFITQKADEMISTWAPCAYMIAPPKAYYEKYDERHFNEQYPSQETLDAIDYIKNESAIKAVIAGHIHENFDGFADCGKRQVCTAPLKDGVVREIEIL